MQIDRFLAQELSPAQSAAFTNRLAAEPALASELARQKLLTTSFSRTLVPADPAAILAAAAAATDLGQPDPSSNPAPDPAPRAPQPTSPAPLAPVSTFLTSPLGLISIAAALLVLSTVIILFAQRSSSPSSFATPAALLQSVEFAPTIAASDAPNLELVLSEKLNRQISLPATSDLRFLGLRTDAGVSTLGIVLLAEYRGQRILFILDPSTPTPSKSAAQVQPSHAITKAGIHLQQWSADGVPNLTPQLEVR